MTFNDRTTYIHLRQEDDVGPTPFGGATIALQQDETGVKVGIAVCHEHDRYVKAAGRVRALGRLHSHSQENERFRLHLDGVVADDIHAATSHPNWMYSQAFQSALTGNSANRTPAIVEAMTALHTTLRKAGCKVL